MPFCLWSIHDKFSAFPYKLSDDASPLSILYFKAAGIVLKNFNMEVVKNISSICPLSIKISYKSYSKIKLMQHSYVIDYKIQMGNSSTSIHIIIFCMITLDERFNLAVFIQNTFRSTR